MGKVNCVIFLSILLVLVELSYTQRSKNLDLCKKDHRFIPNGDHLPSVGSNMKVYFSVKENVEQQCLMRFTTCVSCKLNLTSVSSYLSFSTCHKQLDVTNSKCTQGCTYLHVFDPDYRNETTKYFTGPFDVYRSESKTMYIVFCSNGIQYKHVNITLQLSVEEKKEVYKGSSQDIHTGYNQIVMSPFFPNYYAENSEEYIYEFRAVNHEDYVFLVFDDWNLSPYSTIQFENTNIQGPVKGSASRPSVLSNGPYIKLHFKTGKSSTSQIRSYMGFKLSYKFYDKRKYVQRRETNCGEYILNRDGGTLMFQPSSNINDFYDCIWVVKVQKGYDSVYCKLEAFESIRDYDSQNRLEIRNGLTSQGTLKASVSPGTVDASSLYGHDSDTGFYIRLYGRYRDAKDFILTYASYKLGECVGDRYFNCDNKKCINSQFVCDGYNHCGDGSDEKSYSCNTYTRPEDSPNSYTLSVGVIIPIVISVFLIVVICLLLIFIRRCRRLQSTIPDDSQRISTVSSHNPQSGGGRGRRHRSRQQRISMNLTISQDSPPTYDEVIRSTPIGHLNMAFMWSNAEDGVIQPPTYEEAISSTGDLPQLSISHNLSSSSTETTASAARPVSELSSSTDSSYHQRPRQISSSSSSSAATVTGNPNWPGEPVPSSVPHSTSRSSRNKPQDDLIVSANALGDKPNEGQAEHTQGHAPPQQLVTPKECGMRYDPENQAAGAGISAVPPNSAVSSDSQDIDTSRALQEYVARKKYQKKRASNDGQTSNGERSESHVRSPRHRHLASEGSSRSEQSPSSSSDKNHRKRQDRRGGNSRSRDSPSAHSVQESLPPPPPSPPQRSVDPSRSERPNCSTSLLSPSHGSFSDRVEANPPLEQSASDNIRLSESTQNLVLNLQVNADDPPENTDIFV
ncbi:hypothetical protein LOTGIDRAFT_167107 [Lottia gigantea]|uniref:CUB domain-containing protein n=1 Tax=Lottia gigantea TaxID=225164 RepID=V3Z6X9_LOTGI|nr:hypothetical protein LOTGIDRAFT_167107 [Lottia gigantea]ESO86583.1 hypothetical protein LOTGIDRAFT_167107 [Lottia gigantea]